MRRVLALLLVLGAAAPVPTLAAPASFTEVESELMCDTCNVALPIAESTRADQERAQIRRLIAQGKTKQQILGIFRAEYGPNVLARPTGGGSAVAAWAVPAAILAAALLVVALLLPRWRRRRGPRDPPAASQQRLSQDDEARLERDLALHDL